MFKTPLGKRVALVLLRYLLLVAAILCVVKAFTLSLDEDGTREMNLVRTNGSTFCPSCMGLYE